MSTHVRSSIVYYKEVVTNSFENLGLHNTLSRSQTYEPQKPVITYLMEIFCLKFTEKYI